DLRRRLLARHHADALSGHDRAVLDVALDHGPPQCTRPEMLDRELCLLLIELARAEAPDHLVLELDEPTHAGVLQRAHRYDRKARIHLDRGDGVACAAAEKDALEIRMRDRFGGADEPGSELAAGCPHLQIGEHRFAATDPARDEHRHLADHRQDLLREYAGRDRADMPTRFGPFDDERVGTVADELPRE